MWLLLPKHLGTLPSGSFKTGLGREMPQKIALITPPTHSHRTAEETLALGYLGTQLREVSYDVVIVDAWLAGLTKEELVERVIQGGSPTLVGMSCYRSNLKEAAEVLRMIRDRVGPVPAICGGYGPTFHHELFVQSGFDVVVLGEAEHVVVPLIQTLLAKKDLRGIPGIAFVENGAIVCTRRSEPVMDLDTIQFPARDSVPCAIRQGNFVHVCTSRGCEATCHFCSVFAFATQGSPRRRWRARSVSNIVDELESLHQRFGVQHFKFVDDSFLEPPRGEAWAWLLCETLAKRGLSVKFRTQVRADRLTHGIVEALKHAGWFATSVGIENASETALTRMGKAATLADNMKSLELLEQHGVYVQMGLILFDPETTVTELQENLAFLNRFRWPTNKGIFTEMYAAEGTPFTNLMMRRGRLSESSSQNYRYLVSDPTTRRVYTMLKTWHASHARVYDWVIDSLTAPKVLPEYGYRLVYTLYQRLQELDLRFFDACLQRVVSGENSCSDAEFTLRYIETSAETHRLTEGEIGALYKRFGLRYDAVPNPFLA